MLIKKQCILYNYLPYSANISSHIVPLFIVRVYYGDYHVL